MDWKHFYAEELASARGRAAALDALSRHAQGDPVVRSVLREGGVASFPHVSIHDSAVPIARVVQSILENRTPRVVALGVLHGGTLPAAYREAHAALQQGVLPQAEEAFHRIGGAFFARGAVATPFGRIEDGASPPTGDFVREGTDILDGEFSLDLFLALLAAAAFARGVPPPAVTRLYVGATRSPQGGFAVAEAMAAAVRGLLDADTACVVTGDLVHIGHGYTPAAQVAMVPADAATLQATLPPQIDAMHRAALADRDFAAASALGARLLSDQRHLLPVIAALLGPGAAAEQLSFTLSDYAAINGQPPPCFVAAVLAVFRPGPGDRR